MLYNILWCLVVGEQEVGGGVRLVGYEGMGSGVSLVGYKVWVVALGGWV